jgi:hypothetical protein
MGRLVKGGGEFYSGWTSADNSNANRFPDIFRQPTINVGVPEEQRKKPAPQRFSLFNRFQLECIFLGA